MKYRFAGKERRLALGVYPEISLKEANKKCTEARKLLEQNVDPSQAKRNAKQMALQKCENTFEALAREWHDTFKDKWTDRHAKTVLRRMEHDLFPEIGSMPIADIRPTHIIHALKKVEKRGANEPARRLRQYCAQVFRYAIIHEKAQINPASEVGMVLKKVVKSHYA